MARISCFSVLLVGKKKKSKESPIAIHLRKENANGDLRVKPEELVYASIEKARKEASFEDSVSVNTQAKMHPSTNVKLVGNGKKDENLVRTDVALEAAYEGGDEHDEMLSMTRVFSDYDLQALAAEKEKGEVNFNQELSNNGVENELEKDEGITPEVVVGNGHVSDPGMGRTTAFWGSPMLKRSCSNIETKRASKLLRSPAKNQSYDDLQNLSGNFLGEAPIEIPGSPASVRSACSADKVMLKKRSSSQVLPSRSRKLWWKLFLWSHRNLHKTWSLKPQRILSLNASNRKDGYCSDTLELSCGDNLKNKKAMEETDARYGMWPPNQWVAFSAESSPLDRVNAWVHSLDDNPFCPIEDNENEDDDDDDAAAGPSAQPSFLEIGESSNKSNTRTGRRAAEEVLRANNTIQSLNSFSSVAHIAGMGLKVIPAISAFTSLRSINLSGNFIVHISPGSLPKSLHMLDLSRNKIATIEGLRELTRLRVLNLSYNRIARIGHGLSNCTLIKELYLAGNKISGVEGLHRLLKLTVLDLSFNKITTAKAMGQLVANYHSLLALNLLGNPIHGNIGDDQLRKAVCSLLPHLAYLNKQPIKPLRAREVATDSVAKAALGNSGWSSRRRSTRRVGHGSSMIGEGSSHRGVGSTVGHKNNRQRSKGRHQHSISTRK